MNNCLHSEYFIHHCIFFYSMNHYIKSLDGPFCYLSFAKQMIGGILCCRQQLLKFCSSFQARFLYVLFTLRMVLNLVLPVLLMAVERYAELSLASRAIVIVGISQSFYHLSLKMRESGIWPLDNLKRTFLMVPKRNDLQKGLWLLQPLSRCQGCLPTMINGMIMAFTRIHLNPWDDHELLCTLALLCS